MIFEQIVSYENNNYTNFEHDLTIKITYSHGKFDLKQFRLEF